jgi:hypothetical protein
VDRKQRSPAMEKLDQWKVRDKSKSLNVRQEKTETPRILNKKRLVHE